MNKTLLNYLLRSKCLIKPIRIFQLLAIAAICTLSTSLHASTLDNTSSKEITTSLDEVVYFAAWQQGANGNANGGANGGDGANGNANGGANGGDGANGNTNGGGANGNGNGNGNGNSGVGSLTSDATASKIVFTPSTSNEITTQQLTDMPDPADIKIFPNPVTNELSINLAAFIGQKGKVEIVDLRGQTMEILPNQLLTESPLNVDVSTYPKGMYLLMLNLDGEQVLSKKIIISKE